MLPLAVPSRLPVTRRAAALLALAVATSATSAAPPARAADKPPPSSPPAPETADSLYNQGNEAYDRGDHALALELYKGAFKLRASYDIARNLGLCELKLGRLADAIGHFEYSLSHYPSNRADTKKQVVDWLAQAKAGVGALRLTASPEGAECLVRGAALTPAQLGADVPVDPGDVPIDCHLEGHRTEKRTVTIARGERKEVTVTLALASGPGGGGGGGAGGTDTPPRGAERRTILMWTGAATAVTGVGVGAVMGVLSLVKAGEADGMLAEMRTATGRSSPCAAPAEAGCADLKALRREQDVLGNTAFWMLLAGGVAGAGTAAFVLVTRPREPTPAAPAPKVALVPVVAPGGAGALLTGSF